MFEMRCDIREALRFKLEMSSNINEYAVSFLAIYNNVKSSRELLKMYNDYGDCVYVVCEKESKDAAESFLSQFGKIVSIETVEVVQPMGYDYEYRDDFDTEFLAVEEI